MMRWNEVARRIGVLLLAGFLGACLVRIAPGYGISEESLDARLNADSLAQLRKQGRRDHNVFTFYGAYLLRAAHGDLGYSQMLDRPVVQLLGERLPLTLKSAAIGLTYAWLGAGLLACAMALARIPALENIFSALSGLVLCVPAALLGLLLFLLDFQVAAGIGALVFPKIYTYTRGLIEQGLNSTHVITARAQGVNPIRVLLFHAIAPARLEMLALFAITLIAALGSAVPLEVVCDAPGIGQLAWRAAIGRDMPLLTALTLVMAAITLTANSLSDLLGAQWVTTRANTR